MSDFISFVRYKKSKNDEEKLYASLRLVKSSDLMVRSKKFVAVWDEENDIWSTDEHRFIQILEAASRAKAEEEGIGYSSVVESSTGVWDKFQKAMGTCPDMYEPLDSEITYADTVTTKNSYRSRRLPFSLSKADCPAFKKLMGRLFDDKEREKLLWAIGAIATGDARRIQKFIVLYGDKGTGKSTYLNIVRDLFEGYCETFVSATLVSRNDAFATSIFAKNPLLLIEHDGDLSHIDTNSTLNTVVSHEPINVNQKYVAAYPIIPQAMLMIGTNSPVKITDAKSGVSRRLIDVYPSNKKFSIEEYTQLVSDIRTELGAVMNYCIEFYRERGANFYKDYLPVRMQEETNPVYSFLRDHYFELKDDGIGLAKAWTMYREWCENTNIQYPGNSAKFKSELRVYFRDFYDRKRVDNERVRNYFSGLKTEMFGNMTDDSETEENKETKKESVKRVLVLDQTASSIDDLYAQCPAQLSTPRGTPTKPWKEVTTVLADIDTSKEHYVRIPENHIVIDFDLRDEKGEKNAELNLEAASEWPETYAEFSKSGSGVHLHYIYDGDPTKLSRVYGDGVEIKVFTGLSSLRRRVSKCNNKPLAHISSGLPRRKDKKVLNNNTIETESKLRNLIEKNLRKEVHPATKPSIDFIFKLLEDAHEEGITYDVTDMKPKVLAFAMSSTNQASYCTALVTKMKFKSETSEDDIPFGEGGRIVFFDVEVFPNLFLINWKYQGSDNIVRMINPDPEDVKALFSSRLVGFNNRRYDNHILYARSMGYSLKELYILSKNMIAGNRRGIGEAYNLSYTDIYDFSTKKQSLKKWQIEMGIHHQELGMDWDQPVPEEKWTEVSKYCDNDVISTEKLFEHLESDWVARQTLAGLSGLTVNDTTNAHTTRIIFGRNRKPQDEFVYTDLGEMFEGYTYSAGKSEYRGEVIGEGGYVYSEPGMYEDVALLDVASMHPNSLINLNAFGDRYTKRFKNIVLARLAVKHGDVDKADELLDGALKKSLKPGEEINTSALAQALKIAINSVYGLTSAAFDNPFRDPRNVDNIVAKRGALFMVDLKHYVQERGFTVAHIKTDSIKIPHATPEIIQEVMDFGKKYGYTFEHETTYDRMCLVNKAVYISHSDHGWGATGKEFAEPYVFKKLFSGEEILPEDLGVTKESRTALYLDYKENEPRREFVGRSGLFLPVKPGCGGGSVLRQDKNDKEKFSYAAGTKDYLWKEYENIPEERIMDEVDFGYYDALVDAAAEKISEYGDLERFRSV